MTGLVGAIDTAIKRKTVDVGRERGKTRVFVGWARCAHPTICARGKHSFQTMMNGFNLLKFKDHETEGQVKEGLVITLSKQVV